MGIAKEKQEKQKIANEEEKNWRIKNETKEKFKENKSGIISFLSLTSVGLIQYKVNAWNNFYNFFSFAEKWMIELEKKIEPLNKTKHLITI